MVNLEIAVTAFADSVAHVFEIEAGSNARWVGDVCALTHAYPIQHPYPREFDFLQEFIAVDGDPVGVVQAVRESLVRAQDDHVLYVFSHDVAEKIPMYESLGYRHAWNNALMITLLEGTETEPAQGLRVRDVRNTADIIAYQDLTGSAAVAHSVADGMIHSFLCEDAAGEPLGRGQVVTRVNLFAYVSGMFTAPMHRQRGVGTALMGAMHTRALQRGARFCLLIPSRMATEINFYPRFNYETVAPHAVFIPAAKS